MTLIDLLLCHLDDFLPASKAAENPDLAFGNAEMLCQQSDDCLVGLALSGRLLNFDYEAIAFPTDLFSSGIGPHPNLDSHLLSVPVFPGYEILPV